MSRGVLMTCVWMFCACVRSAPAHRETAQPRTLALLDAAVSTQASDGGAAMGHEYSVGRGRIRVSLALDSPSVMLGEPLWGTFAVENVGAEPVTVGFAWMGRNELGRPENIRVQARDAQGTLVPVPDSGPSFGGMSWEHTIAPGARQTQRMLLNLWAPFAAVGAHAIALETALPLRAGSSSDAGMTDVPVSAQASVNVVAEDAARFAALITALEARVLRHDDEASRSLTWMRDPRVIDALVRLARRPLAGDTVSFLFALGRFDDERAVAALERSLRITAADLDPSRYATDALRAQSAESLRLASAQALDRCRHPRAEAVLLSLQNDSNDNVRLTVLHHAARLPRARSEPVIRRMLTDRATIVRGEAERYLRELR